MSKSFALYVTKYFGEYLPHHKGVSENTLRSYRDTFVQIIEYLGSIHKIPCSKISFENFTRDRILGFLDYLEIERKVSPSTRNQRLAAIHSFFHFIQRNELSYFSQCAEILAIEFKKTPEPVIEYLSIEEQQFLFSLPDVNNHHEIRDLAILTTLYETGARVQELIDLRLGSISLYSCPTIILNGKGNKTRTVPIGSDTASILKNYIREYAIIKAEQHLFTNSRQNCLTRVGVQYIINKYVERGRKLNPEMFNKNITNHSFRHSKSMHLLEAGVNLLYIRDFLGHTSVTTTEIYAKANAEIKRKVIEQHGALLDIQDKYSMTKKDELLDWLKSDFK
jgi:Site-specific recombinase XerD